MSEGGEQENQRGNYTMFRPLCLGRRARKPKGPKQDSYNRLRYPMSEGGEPKGA